MRPFIREPRFLTRRASFLTLAFAASLAASAGAQQAPAKEAARPFAALSASAQRVRDSASKRLGSVTVAVGPMMQLESRDREAAVRDSITQMARAQLGAQYRLGAESPGKGFDCSGLVRFVLSALRIDMPRTARTQALAGRPLDRDTAQLRPGDLLTFGRSGRVTHVGIYVGEGRFVHASTTRQRVVESRLTGPGTWFAHHWLGVRRVVAVADSVS
jgi:cell wall-associated NlpC family hydrolase